MKKADIFQWEKIEQKVRGRISEYGTDEVNCAHRGIKKSYKVNSNLNAIISFHSS